MDFGVRLEYDLEVRSRIRLELAKVGNLAILIVSEKFDIGVEMEFRNLE